MEPVKPAVTLLKEVGEAGQHDDVTEDIGVRVITVADGHDKSQPSGCLLEGFRVTDFDVAVESLYKTRGNSNASYYQSCHS